MLGHQLYRLAESHHPWVRQRARHQEAATKGRVDEERSGGADRIVGYSSPRQPPGIAAFVFDHLTIPGNTLTRLSAPNFSPPCIEYEVPLRGL